MLFRSREESHMHQTFVDPGNMCLDIMVHLIKAWRWMTVDDTYVKAVHTHPYGHPLNVSSVRRVNLRENIIERLASHLQQMGHPEWWSQPKSGKKGKNGHGKGL